MPKTAETSVTALSLVLSHVPNVAGSQDRPTVGYQFDVIRYDSNFVIHGFVAKLIIVILRKIKTNDVIFSERTTLRSLYAISRPSVVCCLSVVCDVGAPYSGG